MVELVRECWASKHEAASRALAPTITLGAYTHVLKAHPRSAAQLMDEALGEDGEGEAKAV